MELKELVKQLKRLLEIRYDVDKAQQSIDTLLALGLLPDKDDFWNNYHEFLKNSAELARITAFNPGKHHADFIIKRISEKVKRIESDVINFQSEVKVCLKTD